LKVLVRLDEEKDARTTRDNLIKAKLISEQSIVFVSESFPSPPKEADIEDLLEPEIYVNLVKETYSKELLDKKFLPNEKVPRIAKRIEAALNEVAIEFHKTRPARLFLKKMATDPKSVLTDESLMRFENLFKIINERMEKQFARAAGGFKS
jgi:hypothetical protein